MRHYNPMGFPIASDCLHNRRLHAAALPVIRTPSLCIPAPPSRHSREGGNPSHPPLRRGNDAPVPRPPSVIPAKAGIQERPNLETANVSLSYSPSQPAAPARNSITRRTMALEGHKERWIPACAGMTERGRGNDGKRAGMTVRGYGNDINWGYDGSGTGMMRHEV